MLTGHQKTILSAANIRGGKITKQDAVEVLRHVYFVNAEKHVGDVLSRMVASGILKRIKPGVFEVGGVKKKAGDVAENENQTKLF
jgi:predicted transcriptional regulator of viral defense system